MSLVERFRIGMSVTHAHTGPRVDALLADPVVEPAVDLPVVFRRAVGPRVVGPVVSARDVSRVQVAAFRSRIAVLESRLAAAERRRDATIERYERILERRTERFRSWVQQGDPRPDEFTWLGRSKEATLESVRGAATTAGDSTEVEPVREGGRAPVEDPTTVERVWAETSDPVRVETTDGGTRGTTGEPVATDGGRDRSRGPGLLSRLLEYVAGAVR
jgi:hypothetical protein